PSAPPPRSTLFPYTTLFQSEIGVAANDQRRLAAEFEMHFFQGRSALRHDQRTHLVGASEADHIDAFVSGQQLAGSDIAGDDIEQDRKSTRLNSSHVKISYAV